MLEKRFDRRRGLPVRIMGMDSPSFVPKRGALLSAVKTILGQFPDKSSMSVRLQPMSKAQWTSVVAGASTLVVPFQLGATESCYALKLVVCDEEHPLAVEVTNYGCTTQMVDEWADRLWELWDKPPEEDYS